jgi:hypothetical protein
MNPYKNFLIEKSKNERNTKERLKIFRPLISKLTRSENFTPLIIDFLSNISATYDKIFI